jgi:hypothetical protein
MKHETFRKSKWGAKLSRETVSDAEEDLVRDWLESNLDERRRDDVNNLFLSPICYL